MQIKTTSSQTILSIREFLGLNENPDGLTAIKAGEMSEMKNFRITDDKHLQIRPGSKTVVDLAAALTAAGGSGGGLHGLWRGYVGAKERTLVAYGGYLWDVDVGAGSARSLGQATESETSFFGFGGKVYLLNSVDYMSWDGGDTTQFQTVEGYVPLVMISTKPDGSGAELEGLNLLTDKRRVQFSPDGTSKEFVLPEDELSEIVSLTLGGAETAAYTSDLTRGAVTMNSAPAAGTNTLEVTYRKGSSDRSLVTGMRYAELYNGNTDSRVFLYGDGSNRAIYSGISYSDGQPSAEYFPALYEVAVGDQNTPLTALVRHYSRLMAFKPNSAWAITYSTLDLSDSSSTAAFYVQPVNRQFGNEALGQVHLLENDPLTLDAGSVYQWKSSGYSTYITSNETNAKRISSRIERTLRNCELSDIRVANIKHDHEYWFMLGEGRALIYKYGIDAWYSYEDLPFDRVFEADTETYGVGSDGRIVHFSRDYRNDDGAALDCYAETGAMDFDRDWLLKYSPMLFVAMQPESGARITVTTETNKRSDYPEKLVAYSLATFSHMDFSHFSFAINRKPQVKRVKIKVKKATYYRLIYKSRSSSATATVIQTDVKLRYAGNVK